jgi:hypothetical protein
MSQPTPLVTVLQADHRHGPRGDQPFAEWLAGSRRPGRPGSAGPPHPGDRGEPGKREIWVRGPEHLGGVLDPARAREPTSKTTTSKYSEISRPSQPRTRRMPESECFAS